MAGTNVPQVTFGPTGFVIPSPTAVLAGVIADIQAAFGNSLNLSIDDTESLTTPQGQLASSWAAVINNAYATFLYYTNQVDPAYAIGRMQDAIARIYFLERDPSEPTTLQIACTGLTGLVIPVGATIQDDDDNIYSCTEAAEIPSGGSVTTSFACQIPGPVPVPSADEVSIYQAIPGWNTATVVSGVQGVDVESRAAFELRREDSVAGNSFGAINSIIGAVAKVPGVIDYFGVDNSTNAPQSLFGVVVAANSIYISVSGGTSAAVAQAIWSKKSPGCSYNGNTTVTVYDDNPLYASPIPYTVSYEIPSPLQILFNVVIVSGPGVPSNAAALIQAALINAFAGGDGGPKARIATTLLSTRYIAPINALGSWAQVASLGIGSANTPAAVVVGMISGNNFTVSSVITGTLAIGQTLSDTTGLLVAGTSIASQTSGSPGGTGVYVVNNPQTVGGATFTGTGSGTNLTASAVTGTIVIGDVIIGIGVPSNTMIISQTSGTAGGAGVYVTSVATTASTAAITTAEQISASSANQTQVSVNANQEPQLISGNIAVSVT